MSDAYRYPFLSCQLARTIRCMLYVGLDVHDRTTSLTVRNGRGVIVERDVIPTTKADFRRRFRNLRGRLVIACEAGPLAGWLSSLLASRLRKVVVCDPRQNRLLLNGTKTDRVDADNLAELARLGALRHVFVGDQQNRQLRRLVKHYLNAQCDRRRVIHRLHGLFRHAGVTIKTPPRRPDRVSLRRLPDEASRFVARVHLEQFRALTSAIHAARERLLLKAAEFPEYKLLQTVPYVGQLRAAELIAIVGTPVRFSSVRQFWAYAGLAVVRRVSAEHRVESGRIVREHVSWGLHLNRNRHVRLKKIFKDIALHASIGSGEFRAIYEHHLARGKSPGIARVALARKVAAIVRAIWRSGEPFRTQRQQDHGNGLRGEHQKKSSVPASRSLEATH